MSKKKLIEQAFRMLQDRIDYWTVLDNEDKVQAYESAMDIMKCALEGDEKGLDSFDYYNQYFRRKKKKG